MTSGEKPGCLDSQEVSALREVCEARDIRDAQDRAARGERAVRGVSAVWDVSLDRHALLLTVPSFLLLLKSIMGAVTLLKRTVRG